MSISDCYQSPTPVSTVADERKITARVTFAKRGFSDEHIDATIMIEVTRFLNLPLRKFIASIWPKPLHTIDLDDTPFVLLTHGNRVFIAFL